MKKWLTRILIACLALSPVAVWADYTATLGSGSTVFSFVCSTTKICPAFVLIDSTNVEKATAGNPVRTDPTGTTTQPVSAASLPLPTGASTAAKQPALGTAGAASADVITVQGIASMIPFLTNPGTPASWGIGAFASAMIANGQAICLYDGTNCVRAKGDETSGLWVNIKAGAGSGGTAIVDNSAFTQSTTNETPVGCLFNTAYAAATSGRSTVLRCLNDGSAFTNAAFWAGTALGAPSAYGTSPGAVNVPGVNAFVTNSNANGRAVSGSSSPVVPTPALSTWHLIAAASTNATSVKGSAATVFSCQLGGIAGPAFLKIYNKATAPTVGTDVPVKTLIIPVAATAANGAGSNISFGPGGLTLATGFAAAVTGVITDADTTAVAAASFAINCDFE